MNVYLDIVQALVGEFESIAISLKPNSDILHADALPYLAGTLEDDSPRKIR